MGSGKKDAPSKPKKVLSSSEIEQRLKSQCEILEKNRILNWTCPFVSCGNQYNSDYIFSRGKGNKLHVLNAETLQTEVQIETAGHGLFSCLVHNDLAWIGCYDGNLFVFDANTFERKKSIKLHQGIYDIMVFEDSRAGPKEEFLVFGQHFGHVDMIQTTTMKQVITTITSKNLKINTIFNLFRTSREYEICFCCYNGMYFAKVNRNLT